MKMSRAEKAGRAAARNLIELAQLMYNESTKKNFYKGLMDVLGVGKANNENITNR